MADTEFQRMVERLSDKEVFLVTDESEVNGKKFFSVLIGDVSQPEETYLVHCRPVQTVDKQSYYPSHRRRCESPECEPK